MQYFVWLHPASQHISATATLARDFFDFYIQQTPTMKKTSKLERKSRGKYKTELFSKPISRNQDAWPATRWMITVPSLFRHLSEGNYHGAHPSIFTAQKWITKKATKNLICELVCIPGIQGSHKIRDSCVTQN